MCWEAVVVTVYMTSVCPLPKWALPGLHEFFSWALTSRCNTSLGIGAQPLHVKPLSRSLRSLIKIRFSLCCHIWYGFPACSLGWGPFTFLISCSCLWSPVIPPHPTHLVIWMRGMDVDMSRWSGNIWARFFVSCEVCLGAGSNAMTFDPLAMAVVSAGEH